jgi:hypothetical protein
MNYVECRAVSGIFGRENRIIRKKSAPCHFVHHKARMSEFGLEPGSPHGTEVIQASRIIKLVEKNIYSKGCNENV